MSDVDQESSLSTIVEELMAALSDPAEVEETRSQFERRPAEKQKFQRDLWALQKLLDGIAGQQSPPIDVDELLSRASG